jgi:cellulose synthase/poly-beta-1,6-N-acetylglucosamine synthase-like glycosyltransferase
MLLSVLFLVLVAMLTGIATTTLAWMLYAWRSPQQLSSTGFPQLKEPRHSFSLLVPARHEEEVLERTLRRIASIDHPNFEVVAIVGHDDEGTAQVAHKVAQQIPHVRVVVDENWPKNTPKALNTALPTCSGDVIGIFDAEDDVHPGLLRHVDTLLQSEGVDVVQSGVQLMNFWSNWYSVRNVLEYYFWFRSRLHFHANARFIPLGGNTVFMRTAVLRRYEGWDADCLAEDCEIGVRLSSAGHAVAVAYHPDMVTREETPPTFMSLMKQRTRWNQGFLQVLRRGEWRQLATRRRQALALYTLSMPFLQSFTGLLIPISILSLLLLRLPMPVVLFGFAPLMITLLVVAMEAVGLSEFGELFDRKPRIRDYARLILGAPFYQVMLAYAALRAVWREYTGRNSWEKTAHVGAHLKEEVAA